MNIYFTGAGGTGKTTTADLLAPRINYGQAGSLSRQSPFEIGTAEHQSWVQEATFKRCRDLDKHVLDRTPLDVYGYDVAYEKDTALEGLDWVCEWLVHEPKPIIFYFPRYWQAEDDGFRPTDDSLLDAVDQAITKTLNRFCVHHYTVANESPEERVEHILDTLRGHYAHLRIC